MNEAKIAAKSIEVQLVCNHSDVGIRILQVGYFNSDSLTHWTLVTDHT